MDTSAAITERCTPIIPFKVMCVQGKLKKNQASGRPSFRYSMRHRRSRAHKRMPGNSKGCMEASGFDWWRMEQYSMELWAVHRFWDRIRAQFGFSCQFQAPGCFPLNKTVVSRQHKGLLAQESRNNGQRTSPEICHGHHRTLVMCEGRVSRRVGCRYSGRMLQCGSQERDPFKSIHSRIN